MPRIPGLIFIGFLYFVLVFPFCALAQTQADRWHFGYNSSMAFYKNSTVHVAYPTFNSQMVSIEGCASISDTAGNLLFYTNGITVWDKTHSIMPNGTGLMGNPQSTQTAIIVQNPGNPYIYYIITTAYHLSINGLRWTEVDMTLNNYKGEVTSNKNILLHTPTTEKICGVKHCNKKDVWIITHDWNSNQFRSFLITSAGINTTPVLSNSGTSHGGNSLNKIGQMKVSMDGKKIACAVTNLQFIELHDFDNTTGIVSNGYVIGDDPEPYYGVEFSRTGKTLYSSSQITGSIYQWNICAGNNPAIKNSKYLVVDSLANAGALQLGPDGKIYRSRNNDTLVDFIEYPDSLGNGCKYVYGAVELWAGMTSAYGLPSFVVDYINPALKIWYEDLNPCKIKQFYFSAFHDTNCVGAFNNILSYYWDFGDTASGANNISYLHDPIHNFTQQNASYTVSLIVTYDCIIDTIQRIVSTGCGTGAGGGGGGNPPTTITVQVCQGQSAILNVPYPTTGTPPFYVAWVPWVGVGFTAVVPPGTNHPIAVVIDINGYGVMYSFNIVTVPPPTVSAWGTAGCTVSTLCANVTGGAFPYSIYPPLINSGGNTYCDQMPPGNYTVTVTDGYGCFTSTNVNVPAPTGMPLINVSMTPVSCYGGSDGTADVSATSGGTPPYTFVWSNGGGGSSQSGLSAGFYWVEVFDNANCWTITNFTITEPPPLEVSNVPLLQNPSCPGLSDGTAELVFTGGTPPYSYLWSNGTTSSMATNLPGGSHTVTVTDANGCSYDTTIVLIDPSPIILQTVSTPATCPGIADGTASVTPTGGLAPYTYLWSNGASTDTATGLAPGTYFVTTTDASGCTMTDSVTVNQLTSVIPNVDNFTDATCNGASDGTAVVSATGGTAPYNYLWPNGNTSNFDNNLSANNYSVLITDANGCTSTINVIINEPPPYTVSINNLNDVTCFGGNDGSATVQISAGVQPISYLWSNNFMGDTQSGLIAGSYTVTATDDVGCSAFTTVNINEPAQLNANILNITNITCFGADDGSLTAGATGGISPYVYQWSNNFSGNNISGLAPGVYDVTIIDNNNCTSSATAIITEPAELIASVTTYTDVSCFGGTNGTASVSVTGGTSPFNYSWSSGSNAATATNLFQGIFYVTVTDANGCTSSSSVVINEPAELVITSLTATDETCGDSNATASVTGNGGVNPYSYLWSNGDTTAIASNLSAGILSVTITDANGCTINNSITITNIPGPILSLATQQNTTCFSYCDGSINLNVNSGTAPFNYAWSNNPNNNTSNAINLCAGIYDITVTDSNGCINTISLSLTEPAQVLTTVSPDTIICIGESIMLSATATGGTPGYNYNWTPGNFLGPDPLVSPTITTFYSVDVTDVNGCTAPTENITVTVIPLPNIFFTSDFIEGCEPLCVNFTNLTTDAATCDWYFANQAHVPGCDVEYCFNKPGKYDVTLHVTDIYGCSNNIWMNDYITVFAKPEADFIFTPDYATIFEPFFNFNSTSSSPDVTEWLWKFGDPHESISLIQNPFFIYRDTGTFIVTLIVTNDEGCKDSTKKSVVVEELFTIFIPSAFTPGQINPLFKPVIALQHLDSYNFKIINRWGETVFKTDRLEEGWLGIDSPEGVYIYVLEAQHRGKNIKKMGHVTLLR